jgi:hypothetical protein
MAWRLLLIWLLCPVWVVEALAEDQAARNNYMLHCQGCHTPDGSGAPGKVPSLKGFMGHFLAVDGGREFLIRVPGAAQSALSDSELAAVSNWMLINFSGDQLPADFRPYTAPEVSALRADVLIDVASVRAGLVARMQDAGIVPPQ